MIMRQGVSVREMACSKEFFFFTLNEADKCSEAQDGKKNNQKLKKKLIDIIFVMHKRQVTRVLPGRKGAAVSV